MGVSGDSIKSHKSFAEKKGLNFALISDDEEKTVHNLFQTWQLKKMCGKEYMGTVRTTFVLDENAKVIKEFNKVNTKIHGEEVLDFLNTL